MSNTVRITDVPPDMVQQVMDDFGSEGASVTSEEQADGNYTVTATWS